MPLLVPAATACFLLGAVILFLGIAILRDGGRDRLHRVTALMLFFGGVGALLAGLSLAVQASAPRARPRRAERGAGGAGNGPAGPCCCVASVTALLGNGGREPIAVPG